MDPSTRPTPTPINVLTLTATQAAAQLANGTLTSEQLVLAYLAQISQHNHSGQRLNALISTAPRSQLLATARALDAERLAGHLRSSLHAIPFVVKDVFLALDLPTTAGGPCFASATAKRTAPLLQHLLAAGIHARAQLGYPHPPLR